MATRTESVDLCIVGSGAGGSVIAYEAARRGLRTLVLERGPRVAPHQMSHDELEMIPKLYKHGGLQMTSTMDLFILQGSCVGGSTVLSNMVMLRPEPSVFEAWSRFGADYDVSALSARYDEVGRELEVSYPPSENVSMSSRLFAQGARALRFQPQMMLKALGSCSGCGFCNVGCTFGSKRDAAATYLQWAEQAGARVLADVEVQRVRYRGGLASGVLASVGRARDRLEVKARVIVVAAGAIGSSTVLQNSGLRGKVGTRLSFNAGSMVAAEFDEPLDAYDADQMTLYLKGPGYVIEATHNPPMSAALTTPGWFGEHAQLMRRLRHLAYAGALVATEPVGKVTQSRLFGHEEVQFAMTSRDIATLQRGIRQIAEVFFAAGAKRVFLPSHRFVVLDSAAQLDLVEASIRSTKDAAVGSAHPQGGNPISSDPRLGVVGEDLRVHGFENLFVCDASVFPSCIGVNPIFTIMSLAKHASTGIMARA